ARGERSSKVGAGSSVAGTVVPSQKRTPNGRSGSARASSRRRGAVSRVMPTYSSRGSPIGRAVQARRYASLGARSALATPLPLLRRQRRRRLETHERPLTLGVLDLDGRRQDTVGLHPDSLWV